MLDKKIPIYLSVLLLVGAGFCFYQVHTGNAVGHHNEVKKHIHRENEYKNCCLNSECSNLAEKDFLN